MSVARIGVLGAGTMGAGIAQVAALGGYETRLYDAIPGAAEAGAARLGEALAKGAARGRWSEADAEAAANRVSPAPELEQLAGCDLLIEAAPEDLALKRQLFAAVAEVCGPEAILATNTSSLQVAAIAAGVPEPQRVVGMHFFNPPALMKLVEVVATAESSERALAATAAVAERMGRTPIRASDTPGFVANRLARPFNLEALRMLGDGLAEPEEIDRAYKLGGGFKMGPFELIDLIGLDVNLAIARSFFAQGGEPERWRPSPIQERMVEEGRLGRKSGKGFYAYDEDGSQRGVPYGSDRPKKPTATKEIVLRLFAQIANEAHFALEERIASPEDMDTATRLGLNWPLGSLEIAEQIGPRRALETLERLEAEHGGAYAAAPLLREAAGR
ncbi:MAG TPA: 3-hydroxyacyl-CoA dehydrogenase NAD-binding domain-containing protein [Solirubrobacterales bacterium]|jgi:3-hydroxybutyryl-CoA dehydrogenase|nr:3-hydroxyacyl-CoA dehydrogenase NAD-binding domain-containing protein [Solirubrobacterales bacterium]